MWYTEFTYLDVTQAALWGLQDHTRRYEVRSGLPGVELNPVLYPQHLQCLQNSRLPQLCTIPSYEPTSL